MGLWVLGFMDDWVDGAMGSWGARAPVPVDLWTINLWTCPRTYPRASIRAHASLSVTVRLKTGFPGALSGSTAK